MRAAPASKCYWYALQDLISDGGMQPRAHRTGLAACYLPNHVGRYLGEQLALADYERGHRHALLHGQHSAVFVLAASLAPLACEYAFLTICCTADFDTVCHTSSFRYTHAAIRAASAIRCWLVLARASPGFDCHATWRYVIHRVSPSSTIAPRLVPTGPFNLRSPLGPHPKAPAFRLFNHEGVRPRGYVGQR
jgi:hypothetical protein